MGGDKYFFDSNLTRAAEWIRFGTFYHQKEIDVWFLPYYLKDFIVELYKSYKKTQNSGNQRYTIKIPIGIHTTLLSKIKPHGLKRGS